MKILLFQSVRELLFNAVKHSKARTARVEVKRVNDCIRITVSDKGAGFDPARLRMQGAPRAASACSAFASGWTFWADEWKSTAPPARAAALRSMPPWARRRRRPQ